MNGISKENKLITAGDILNLKKKLKNKKVFVIPHHIGYIKGERGINWDAFTEDLSPVVEICSDHGEFENDEDESLNLLWGAMGPRVYGSTIRKGLLMGYKFGFIGSTDNHTSFPGAHTGGKAGVYTKKLTKKEVWDALLARRTVASKGDSISLWMSVNDAPLGSEIKCKDKKVSVKVNVIGEDAIEKIELVKNSKVINAFYPKNFERKEDKNEKVKKYKVRVQFGWGKEFNLMQWIGIVRVKNGNIIKVTPYFTHANGQPTDKGGLQKLVYVKQKEFKFDCLAAGYPQQYVMEIEGSTDTEIILESNNVNLKTKIKNLLQGSIGGRIRKHVSPAVKICRAIEEREYKVDYEFNDIIKDKKNSFYYVIITQKNLSRCWASPVWLKIR